jgi:LmbE family N-acetylglucosaminyl deacetylase
MRYALVILLTSLLFGTAAYAAKPGNAAASMLPPPAATHSTGPLLPGSGHCGAHKDLAIVAHQDDDLLFMNPDLQDTINQGGCLMVLYLTAGDRGEGEPYMLGRERGVRAAYAYMAGAPNTWQEDSLVVNQHTLARFTLKANPHIQLVHMRLHDPWLGHGWGSLTPLSRTETNPAATVQALGPYGYTYNRAELTATVAALIRRYQPTTIRHQDNTVSVPYAQLCWRCTGHDHPDHISGARLVRDAMAQAPGPYASAAYLDYPSQERPANLTPEQARRKTEAFRIYASNDYRYCNNPASCRQPTGPAAAWVQRRYYISNEGATPRHVASGK